MNETPAPIEKTSEFYIVSKQKFAILYILTLGLYLSYWFYKNWRLYQKHNNVSIMPIWRTVFMLFFMYLLFTKINTTLVQNNPENTWNYKANAILVLTLLLLSHFFFNILPYDITWYDLIPFGLIAVCVFPLMEAQDAINHAMLDPDAKTNAEFTLANYLWSISGGILLISIAFLILFEAAIALFITHTILLSEF